MRTGDLVAKSCCPICTSQARRRNEVPVMDTTSRGHYVEWLLKQIGPGAADCISRIHEYSCLRCGTLYRDPYFAIAELSKFYVEAAPHHKAGWKNLLDIAAARRVDTPSAPAELFQNLEGYIPQSCRYFEIGCPFTGGLVSAVASPEARSQLRTLLAGGGRKPYLSRSAGRWAVAASMASRVWARGLWSETARDEPRDLPRVARDGSSERYVVVDDSSQRWGLACSSFGTTCWQLSSATALGTVIGLSEYRALIHNRDKPAVVAFFDSLDHCGEPSEHLELAFSQAHLIVICSHSPASAALQHQFAVTVSSMKYLATRYSDFTHLDLSSAVDPTAAGPYSWHAFIRAVSWRRSHRTSAMLN